MSNKCATQSEIKSLNWGGDKVVENNSKLCTIGYAISHFGCTRKDGYTDVNKYPNTRIITLGSDNKPIELKQSKYVRSIRIEGISDGTYGYDESSWTNIRIKRLWSDGSDDYPESESVSLYTNGGGELIELYVDGSLAGGYINNPNGRTVKVVKPKKTTHNSTNNGFTLSATDNEGHSDSVTVSYKSKFSAYCSDRSNIKINYNGPDNRIGYANFTVDVSNWDGRTRAKVHIIFSHTFRNASGSSSWSTDLHVKKELYTSAVPFTFPENLYTYSDETDVQKGAPRSDGTYGDLNSVRVELRND